MRVIQFRPRPTPTAVLNAWSGNVNALMALVEKTLHLIIKEEMVHKLVSA